jgi:hypothetical protein
MKICISTVKISSQDTQDKRISNGPNFTIFKVGPRQHTVVVN